MNREVILIDEDYEQPQQVYTAAVGTTGRERGIKRTFNGLTIQPVQNLQQLTANTLYSTSDGTVHYQPPESVIIPAVQDTISIDEQDVYYIEELDEDSGQVTTMQIPVVQQQEFGNPEPEDDEPRAEAIVPEEEAPDVDDYYDVEPLELSEIWNDLITANQEILILLELQDLKHHIVDARRIEDQLSAMTCDYCPKELPDVRAWNRHIKKIHFQTEVFDCDSCSARFKYYARFKDHLHGHSSERPYACDECDHHYATRIGFLVHKILEHMKLNGIYVCPKCTLDCKDAQNYKLHIAKHIDLVPQSGAGAASSSSTQATTTPGSSKPVGTFQASTSDRNKFLNAFENFSQQRTTADPVARPRPRMPPCSLLAMRRKAH